MVVAKDGKQTRERERERESVCVGVGGWVSVCERVEGFLVRGVEKKKTLTSSSSSSSNSNRGSSSSSSQLVAVAVAVAATAFFLSQPASADPRCPTLQQDG